MCKYLVAFQTLIGSSKHERMDVVFCPSVLSSKIVQQHLFTSCCNYILQAIVIIIGNTRGVRRQWIEARAGAAAACVISWSHVEAVQRCIVHRARGAGLAPPAPAPARPPSAQCPPASRARLS